MIDFLLVLIPATLLTLPLVSLASLMHQGLVAQQVAYDVARYGTLADTTDEMRDDYARSKDSDITFDVVEDDSVCRLHVSVSKEYSVTLWPVPINIRSEANAQCEIF